MPGRIGAAVVDRNDLRAALAHANQAHAAAKQLYDAVDRCLMLSSLTPSQQRIAKTALGSRLRLWMGADAQSGNDEIGAAVEKG